MKNLNIFTLLILATMLCGCATNVHIENCQQQAGFLDGVWHGMIIVISFIISFFDDKVAVYAVCNTGFGYNFGFLLGLSLLRIRNVSINNH